MFCMRPRICSKSAVGFTSKVPTRSAVKAKTLLVISYSKFADDEFAKKTLLYSPKILTYKLVEINKRDLIKNNANEFVGKSAP